MLALRLNQQPFFMDIKLDPETLKDVVSAAILKSLDDTKRDALIESAIKYLLTPQGGSAYNKAESPLQMAFNNAVHGVAIQIAKETLEKDATVNANIQALLTEAFTKVMGENREKTVSSISDAIVKGLTHREY